MNRMAIERCVLVVFAAFMLSVPWLVPALVNTFWVSVIAEILIWSLFAASVNLLFGYVGLLSFGQALFFGFGMYGVGIGIDQLHLAFWPAFGLGIVAAMTMALVSGIFAVRLTWHYFAIITVVFSLIFYFIAVTMKPLTGGDDGINFTLPPTFTWGRTQWSFTDATFQYFFILATVSVCFYLMHLVIRSPLGKAFLAIRDNDVRASLIGLNVYLLRLTAFVMAGFLAGSQARCLRSSAVTPPRRTCSTTSPAKRWYGPSSAALARCSVRSSGRACSLSSASSYRRIGSIIL